MTNPLAAGGYVLTFGETMALMSADRPGPLAHASTLTLGIGGAESNVAIGLARLGVSVVWLGRVGADALGALVTREIRAEGVDVRSVIDLAAPTGLMIKERRTPTTQSVAYYRAGSAGSRLVADDLPPRLVEDAAILHLTGITPALSSSARSATLAALGRAHAAGVPVSFDLNYRSALWPREDAGDFYRDVLPSVDVVFAGEDEARMIVGDIREPGEIAHALVAAGAASAVVKLGENGAVGAVDGELHWSPAVPITVLDSVGAGDAFVAAYLAETLSGLPIEARLHTANSAGAFACLVPGDWEGFPRRNELLRLGLTESVTR